MIRPGIFHFRVRVTDSTFQPKQIKELKPRKVKPKNLGRGLSALLPEANEVPAQSVLEASVGDIKPNPHQPRRDFDRTELTDLAASIREKGVIQPLVVRQNAGIYELVAGERRFRAAKMAGLERVPIRIIEVTDDADLLELSLIENLQRHDLNPIDLAEGYRKLHQRWGLTQEQIARRIGKERTTIANTIRLLDLPETIRESVRKREISPGHAKAILSIDSIARQSAVWKKVVSGNLSVRQTEELARAVTSESRRSNRTDAHSDTPLMREYTNRLRRSLGTQVKIVKRGRKGNIRIEFYSEDELLRLIELLSENENTL